MFPPDSTLRWQPLALAEADAVRTLADSAHPGLPERTEVFADRIRLFAEGCRKLVRTSQLVGYGIAHPWVLGTAPDIDTLLGILPATANCLHLHDVVVAPEARGRGVATTYIEEMATVARAQRFAHLTLVSVYGTSRLWSRCGFLEQPGPNLAAYGATARYMVRTL